jgi:hypothetical protein
MRNFHNIGKRLSDIGKKLSDRGRAGGKAWPLAASRGKSLPLESRFTDLRAGMTP